jgi:hypothetical protein
VSATSAASPEFSAAISPSVANHTGSSAAPSESLGSSMVSSLVATPAIPLDRPHTRLQSGVSKPKKFTDGTIRYAYFSSTDDPSSTAEAFKDSR